jgi:hypothetical protein
MVSFENVRPSVGGGLGDCKTGIVQFTGAYTTGGVDAGLNQTAIFMITERGYKAYQVGESGKIAFSTGAPVASALTTYSPALTQTASLRPAGAAGAEPDYDYPAAYASIGVSFVDNCIVVNKTVFDTVAASTAGIPAQLLMGGNTYVGIVFDTGLVTPTAINNVAFGSGTTTLSSPTSLEADGDNILGGKFIEYFSIATGTDSNDQVLKTLDLTTPIYCEYLLDSTPVGFTGNVIGRKLDTSDYIAVPSEVPAGTDITGLNVLYITKG